jgi:hypothetical protein
MKRHGRLIAAVSAGLVGIWTSSAMGQAATAPCGTDDLVLGKKPHDSKDVRGDVALVTDSAVGPEGALWDSPVGVVLESAAGYLTYDLGAPRPVSALYVQADANDTYKVTGSVDGAPGSYKLLAELPNVVDRGHGLRARTVQIPPATIRFLRVGEGNGDGFFSISEVAAFCKAPTPFPPPFRIVSAPLAQPAEAPPPPKPAGDGGRSVLLLVVAALGLAWLAYRSVNRRGDPEAPSGAGAGPESTGAAAPGPAAGSSSGSAADAPPSEPAVPPSKPEAPGRDEG